MISEEEFQRISRFIKARYGIDLSQKKVIVNGRLENYIRSEGYSSFTDYMNAVEKDITKEKENVLVNLLTTNHTYFMRESDHYTFMREVVLPYLERKEEKKKDLAIWCGAASTGEEPYTIAMVLMDYFGLNHSSWDTKVLATDISTDVLSQAIAGVYKKEEVSLLPDNYRRRFFRNLTGSEDFVVSDELKKQVLFRKFNLMDPFPFKRKMHVIFLRNVMIYFDEATKRALIQKIYDVMEPGGYFFIGQTETIDRSATPFELIRPSIYRKIE